MLLTDEDSYKTATMLDRRHDTLPVDDIARVETVMDSIAANLNTEWLKQQCSAPLNASTVPRLDWVKT